MESRNNDNPRGKGRPFMSAIDREKMKLHIAETAKQLFQNEGYANISMRRLAKEAECSPMTLYKYYDRKISVLQTLWEVVFQELFAQLKKALKPQVEPIEKLRIACNFYIDYWLDNPEHYRLVFMAEGVTQTEVNYYLEESEIEAGFVFFSKLIIDVLPERLEQQAKLKVDLLLCALQGIIHNKITISGYNWSDPNAIIDDIINNLS